jgi:hypothetical protein
MKHQAIYNLHSSVVSIEDNDDGTLTCYDADGNVVTFTAAEETAIDTEATSVNDANELRILREVRNKKLVETDWWAGSDRTMTQAETDYRQALRDITDTYSSLATVVWPTKP